MATSRRAAKLVQFSGHYLDVRWARKFIIGSFLQRCNSQPPKAAVTSAVRSSSEDSSIDKELLRLQRTLSEVWSLPARPLDAVSEGKILRLLARYAAGEGAISIEALNELNFALSCIRASPQRVGNPLDMEKLLVAMGYVQPGDNLRRVAFSGELLYPPSALAHMQPYLRDDMECDGSDPFDVLRVVTHGPAYAIDSASTSEVDDAIGVYNDSATGEEYFVVHVSDATVYCPFDSQLEQLTARLLTTTTYLPEGVFFMLPKPIVDAATLREDRPCRTFDVRFQIDEVTGELKNYGVGVGWLHQLRRVTYDEVQALYNEDTHTGKQPHHKEGESTQLAHVECGEKSAAEVSKEGLQPPRPSWMTVADESALRRIYKAAQRRHEARQSRAGDRFIQADLPEPLIKVGTGAQILSVEDQIIGTKDARLAVAEMMIAANEVCSRVAQANSISIPFRGTRELSSDHLAATSYTEPQGVVSVQSLDPQYVYFAEAVQRSIRQLSGVTRAVYFHTPIYHAGLDTHNYTHSTSPLRRYADMLVHHQLKVWLWRSSQWCNGRNVKSTAQKRLPVLIEQPIAEHTMASLCSMISSKQEQASILQEGSQRYWLLRYIEQNILMKNPHHRFICLVGDTRNVECAPEYPRFVGSLLTAGRDSPNEDERGCRSSVKSDDVSRRTVPWVGRWEQRHHEYLYVSEIYITELQFAHVVLHSRPEVVVGVVVECEVREVYPTQGHLSLVVAKVWSGGDERQFEPLWKKCFLPAFDS